MNRRGFLVSLLALPAAVKAVVLKPDLFTYHKVNKFQPAPRGLDTYHPITWIRNPKQDAILDAYLQQQQRIMDEIVRRIALTNPYMELLNQSKPS